jgi:ELWxxDGT repeat protein
MTNSRRLRLTTLESRLTPSASLVADINRQIVNADPANPLVVVNGRLIFEGPGPDNGPAAWSTDGTQPGTGPAPGVQVETTTPGVDFAGAHFFIGTDAAGRPGLWRTDGTAAGTQLVRQLGPGISGLPPTHMTVAGGTLFFVVDQNQLWKSDGTTAGTVRVRTFGTQVAWTDDMGGPVIGPMMAAGDRVFFNAFVPGRGNELWVSDGTAAGTQQVPASMNSDVSVTLLGTVGTDVLFSGWPDGGGHPQLWKTDGTAAGTQVVRADVRFAYPLATFGGAVYFVGDNATHGLELWRSDGTAAGTYMVKDINPSGSGFPLDAVEYGGYLYFTAADDTIIDDPNTFREVWRTDGTEAGTVRVADVRPGPASSDPRSLVAGPDGVYFVADDGTTGREVWKTDGTTTVLVADLEPGPDSSFPTWLTAGPGGVFWLANPKGDGPALYIGRSDGTVQQLAPAWAMTGHTFPTPGVTTGGAHYFWENVPGFGYEVWKTDGTAAGTQRLAQLPTPPGFPPPADFVVAGDTVYFVATHPNLGRELWATDGTPEGTRVVKDIEPESSTSLHSNPKDLTPLGGKVIFTASTSADGRELWVSDGTADGTHMVADLFPGPGDAFPNAPLFTELNGFLYFRATDPVHGVELWRTDGTAEGTTLVTDLPAPWVGLARVATYQQKRVGDRLFFAGQDAVSGPGLWMTDGTGSPVRVADLHDGSQNSNPWGQIGGRLLYWDTDQPLAPYLWATDGTPGGAVRLLGREAPMSGFVTAGGLAYFTTWNFPASQDLWRTDGTPGGTRRVMTFPGVIQDLTVLNDRLYFVGYDPVRGWGLWTSDGTTAGTRLVKDPVTGPFAETEPPHLFAEAGSLFLSVTTATVQPTKVENTLWRSDGTTAGTERADRGNRWLPFAEVNGIPLFEHGDGVTGNELWRYDPVVAGADTVRLEDGVRLDVPATAGVLANDADGQGLPLTAHLVTGPKNGWLTLRPDGSFSYRPFNTDFSGTDTFTYRAAGAVDQSSPTTVTIQVDLVNQTPTPADDTASGLAGRPMVVKVLANDTDPDVDSLTIASFTQGANGRVTRLGNALVYTPRAGAPPTDTFTYTVTDKRGATATATVTVHLSATAPPKIQAVRLLPGAGTGSVNLAALGNRTLPFGHLSRVEVMFSADVSVSADDLRLVGAAGGVYGLSGFAYDPTRRTASWVIDGPATATWSDRVLVEINGVTGPAGVPLGTWASTFSLLVGDVDGNGLVTAADAAAVKTRFGTVDVTQRLFADLDGNGVVDAADANLAAANLGTRKV